MAQHGNRSLRKRAAALLLILMGLFIGISGQLLLTTNRNIPFGFAVLGVCLVAAGIVLLARTNPS